MRGLTYNQNEIGEIIKDTPTDSNNSGACVKASISPYNRKIHSSIITESTQQPKTTLNPDGMVDRHTPNVNQSSFDMTEWDIVPCPY